MPKLRTLLVPLSLFLFAGFAHSQSAVVTSSHAGQGSGVGLGIGSGSTQDIGTGRGGIMGGITGSSFTFNGTPGQPFSADVLEETDKFLADGNHIHRESHGKVFRDSQGRMRTETEVGNLSPESKPMVFITITDPVEQRFIHLDPERKTATISQFGKGVLSPGMGSSVQPKGDTRPLQPASADNARVTEHARQSMRKRSEEDLGTSQIEGFSASGKRYRFSMAAGAMGNDKPTVTTSERWFSPDLKTDLVNSSENPESGKHVRKLLNIQIGEPDPLLFQVPPDFTVRERPEH